MSGNKKDNLITSVEVIKLITAIIALGTVLIATRATIFFGLAIATATAIIITYITVIVIKKFYLPKGVFAVSAIIINEKRELLLIKDARDETYKQPGCHYKINKLKRNNKLETPFNIILENIEEETGCEKNNFKFIDLSKYKHYEEKTLGTLLTDNYVTIKDKFRGYEKNKISPPPFFIMKEESKPKTSGAAFNIDMFYAFKIEEKVNKFNDNVKFYSRKEIIKLIDENKKIYPDLMFVFDNFKRIYEATNFPSSNIRLCTFNTSEDKNILLWRITHNCNAKCDYCLLPQNIQTRSNHTIRIDDRIVQKIINGITDNNIKKLIISGGEPLLVKNLIEIVKKIASESSCESITICTNAIVLKDDKYYNKILELKDVDKFKKFVISIDHYQEEKYVTSKNITNNGFRLSDLETIINKLRGDLFDVFVNVVATRHFFGNPKLYLDYWRKHDFKRLSISFPIKSESKQKFELKDKYDKIISGVYGDVSFFDKNGLELIMPDCNYAHCPSSSNKIFHMTSDGNFSEGCIEKVND